MKKHIALFLAFVMLCGLAACGSGSVAETTDTPETSAPESASPAAESSSPAPEAADPQTQEPGDAQEETGGVLVVYFSATGNTQEAANFIAQLTGGDLFELEAADPYTDDDLNYNDDNSRVSQEHDDESLRDVELVADTVENWDDYDTVFIGYPIWWGIAAWPTNTFVQANDFTGKTVIPFCTSASSGLGESGDLLAELAGTGDWLEGQRFSSNVSEEDVSSWLDSLGLL